jgi:arylsulfatase A
MQRQVRTLAALALAVPQAQAQRPPDVVLVMMDDLGYGDLGSYGASDVQTPNIDRVAREGVRLTDSYACSLSVETEVDQR